MSSLSPQLQNETVAILRHPSWHEPNPFTVIPLPAHDLSQYNTDEIIGFALACRKVFEKLDHPEMGLGINPERLAHINMAVHTLQHATPEDVSCWMQAWTKDLKDTEQHTETLLQNELQRLYTEHQKLSNADKALQTTCHEWIQETLTAHLERSTSRVTLPNFQQHTYQVQKTDRAIESLFRHAHPTETNSLLVEQIILGGRQNPFSVLPLPQTLLAQLLEAQATQPDDVDIKELLLVLKKPLLRLFHSDITNEDRSEQFKKFNNCLKTLEELPLDQCTLLLGNFLKQKQQERNVVLRDLTVGMQHIQHALFLAERDHAARTELFTTLTIQTAALSNPTAFIRNIDAYKSLIALSEKIFIIDRSSSISHKGSNESYAVIVSQHGVLSYAPLPQGCSTDKLGNIKFDEHTRSLLNQQTFTPCGILAGSVKKVEKNKPDERSEIANTLLGLDEATRLSGLSKDIPQTDVHQDSRLIRPLLFLTVLPGAEFITVVPTQGEQWQENLDPKHICALVKDNAEEILAAYDHKASEFHTIGGISIIKKSKDIWIEYKDPKTSSLMRWNIEQWEALQGKEDDLLLLKKISSKLTVEYILDLMHRYCTRYLNVNQKDEAQAGGLKIYKDTSIDAKDIAICIGGNQKIFATSDLRSVRAGDSPPDTSYVDLVNLMWRIQKSFPLKP